MEKKSWLRGTAVGGAQNTSDGRMVGTGRLGTVWYVDMLFYLLNWIADIVQVDSHCVSGLVKVGKVKKVALPWSDIRRPLRRRRVRSW